MATGNLQPPAAKASARVTALPQEKPATSFNGSIDNPIDVDALDEEPAATHSVLPSHSSPAITAAASNIHANGSNVRRPGNEAHGSIAAGSKGVKRSANGMPKPSPTTSVHPVLAPESSPGLSRPSGFGTAPQNGPHAPRTQSFRSPAVPSNLSASSTVSHGQRGDATTVLPPPLSPSAQQIIAALKDAMGRPEPGGALWTAPEDNLLIFLKEETGLPWQDIGHYFPHRASWQTLQTRYSKHLKNRHSHRPSAASFDPIQFKPSTPHTDDARRSTRTQTSRPSNYYPPHPSFIASEEEDSSDVEMGEGSIEYRKHHQTSQARLPFASSNELHLRPGRGVERSDEECRRLEQTRDDAAIAGMVHRIPRVPAAPDASSKLGTVYKTRRKRRSVQILKPYLGGKERTLLSTMKGAGVHDPRSLEDLTSQVLHADFTKQEVNGLKDSVRAIVPGPVQEASDQKLLDIASTAIKNGPFINRTLSSIYHFVSDMANSDTGRPRLIQRLAVRRAGISTGRALRSRELGGSIGQAGLLQLRCRMEETLGPVRSFISMSSDVNTVVWSPNSQHFAAGSFALTDTHSMQYNKPRNLLFGDVATGRLHELPQHMVQREAEWGVNASESMQASQDPYLFTTISALEFVENGDLLLSGSYDKQVKLWDVDRSTGRIRARYRVPCRERVESIAGGPGRLFAVSTQDKKKPIKLYKYERHSSDQLSCINDKRLRPQAESDSLVPMCLRWARKGQTERHLLGGFAEKDDHQRRGEACLWDVEVGQESLLSICKRAVFDVAWSPTIAGRLAVGCSASTTANRGTKSVIRIHDSKGLRRIHNSMANVELECPAWDMNDILFNDQDDFLVTAGCTDSTVYLWDLRRQDKILHAFKHGEPLAELDSGRPREEIDTGVRFTSWNGDGRLLYTGSSDGVVSVWNPYVAPEDAYQYDIARMDSGIMAGRFSPDYTNLLLGDVQGSLLMLSVGNESDSSDDGNDVNERDKKSGLQPFDFVPASDETLIESMKQAEIPKELRTRGLSEVHPAQELVASGKIDIRPLGDFPRRQAVQGPNYDGPYDPAPDADILRAAAEQFQARARDTLISEGSARARPAFFAEDVADNENWRQRIPGNFAKLGSTGRGAFECIGCSQRSISRTTDDTTDPEELLKCTACGGVWKPGVLGYEVVSKPNKMSERSDVVPDSDTRLEPVEALEAHLDLWEVDRLALLAGRS